MIAQLADRCR